MGRANHPVKTAGRRALKARETAGARETALSALDVALGAIEVPAIVVDLGGTVLLANGNALTLIARNRRGVTESLMRAIAGAPADMDWHLTPLRGRERRHGFLAILRDPAREAPTAGSLGAAVRRWHLTRRQAEVLDLVARGFTNALIAHELGIGEGTVEFHLSAIFDKAGVDSRAMLMARAHMLT
jgi:DNA-binding NarL/FixJ family response regulator